MRDVTNLRAMYRKSTKARKEKVNKLMGVFFEDNGIPEFLEYLTEEHNEQIVYEFRASREDARIYAGKYDDLPYDYYYETYSERYGVQKNYIECKASMLSKNAHTFEVQANKVIELDRLKKDAASIVVLCCNLRNGQLISTHWGSPCISKMRDGTAMINTNYCGQRLPTEYKISEIDITILIDDIEHLLSPSQLTMDFNNESR